MTAAPSAERRPIVVLGLPRSGTTWVAGATTVGVGGPYLHEPFNATVDQAQRRWAMRLLDDDALADFGRAFDRAWAPLPIGPAPVVKDVHALFALAQLARVRELPVIVAVRHPCAMANSHHELGWTDTGLERMLDQPALVGPGGPLAPWADHLASCTSDPDAALGATWGAALTVLDHIRPLRLSTVVHEAMCMAPMAVLDRALAELGLELSGDGGRPALHRWLAEHDRPSDDQHSQFRRTAEQPGRWRRSLAPERAARVITAAGPFGHLDRFGDRTAR